MHKTDIERYIIIRSHRVMQRNSNKTDPHIGRSLLFYCYNPGLSSLHEPVLFKHKL